MHKFKKFIYLFIFLLISMYYTNASINVLKNVDPIMQKIKKTSKKYTINPVDAIINNNEITSGSYGKEIDYKESYSKMKRYGKYNESLTVLKETRPTISIEKTYDKYLVKGNQNNRNISLVFKITKEDNIDKLLKLLEEKDVQVTFFIDGTLLEKNINLITKLSNHEIEILSYNNKQDEELMKTTIDYLETITNRKANYCYTEIEDDNLLNICSKNKLHTIKPTIIVKKDMLKNIKKNVEKGIVITINNYNDKELITSINYLKSKGYNLVTLKDLFNEKEG